MPSTASHPKLDRFLVLVNLLAPAVLTALPGGEKIAPQIPLITGAISVAEQIPGATGAEKQAYVRAIVLAGVQVTNNTGKTHLDPAEIDALTAKGIDLVISSVHLVHGVDTVPGTPVALPASVGG